MSQPSFQAADIQNRRSELVERFVSSSPGKLILNVGSGSTRYGEDVINLEIAPEPE